MASMTDMDPCKEGHLYPQCGKGQLCPEHDPLGMGVAPIRHGIVVAGNGEETVMDEADVRLYYMDLFPEADRPVIEELVKLRRDHDAACELAWQLYKAGTGQTVQSFKGVPTDKPWEQVNAVRKSAIAVHLDLMRLDDWLRHNLPGLDRERNPNPVDATIYVLQVVVQMMPSLWRAIRATMEPIISHMSNLGILNVGSNRSGGHADSGIPDHGERNGDRPVQGGGHSDNNKAREPESVAPDQQGVGSDLRGDSQ